MKCFRLARTFDRCWETFSTTKQVNIFLMVSIFVLSFTSVKVVLNNQVHLLHRNRPYSFSRGNITCSLWTNECFRSGFEQETKRCSWKTGKYTVCDGEGSDWTAEFMPTLRYKFSKIFLLKYFSYPLKHLMKQQMKLKIHLFPR